VSGDKEPTYNHRSKVGREGRGRKLIIWAELNPHLGVTWGKTPEQRKVVEMLGTGPAIAKAFPKSRAEQG